MNDVRRRIKAFTLLEVVIVIIIIGVLASLALPRLFKMIERARATEAIQGLQTIRSGIERAKLMGLRTGEVVDNTTFAVNFNILGIDNLGEAPGSNFTYWFDLTLGESTEGDRWMWMICAKKKNDSGVNAVCMFNSDFHEFDPIIPYGTSIKGFGIYDGINIGNFIAGFEPSNN